MPEKRVYDQAVSDLEEKVSYGTLAILENLATHINDRDHLKKNIILVNGDTIIRNCYDKKLTKDEIRKRVSFDIEKLVYFYEQYCISESYLVIYFHPSVYSLIPEDRRRTITESRKMIYELSINICVINTFNFNSLVKLKDNVFAYVVKNDFMYKSLPKVVDSLFKGSKRIWLVTHCPIDYFIIDNFKNVEVMLSHTGEIIKPKQFGKKVFGDEHIPFNKTTYKFFGDKEFLTPIYHNKNKAIEILMKHNVHLRTESEIRSLLVKNFNINQSVFAWKL